jgi:uncharacterized membrane protein YfcA
VGAVRRFVAEREEGLLYALAAAIYIPLGVWLRTPILNWIVGPLFPFLVVYLAPRLLRREHVRTRAPEPESDPA